MSDTLYECHPHLPLSSSVLNYFLMDQDFFHFHENPNPACPVGRTIHGVLDKKLSAVQLAMEKAMEQTTLEALLQEARKEIGDSACE